MPRSLPLLRHTLLAFAACALLSSSADANRGARVKPKTAKTVRVQKAASHARPAGRKAATGLRAAKTPAPKARTQVLADGLNALHAQKLDGIFVPHPNVVAQIREAAGGKLRGPVYVVQYGSEAAEKVTALTKENGMGLIYKGSAGNGHSMAWIGGKLTDSVPGRYSFPGGTKTRLHEFQPQSERPQLVAAFDLPKSMIGKATKNAEDMASAKSQCGADCAGYVREIAVATSNMAKEAGSQNGIAEIASKLQTYQAPKSLRNTSLGLADAVILMVSKHDWRNPASEGYSIHDWNGK